MHIKVFLVSDKSDVFVKERQATEPRNSLQVPLEYREHEGKRAHGTLEDIS